MTLAFSVLAVNLLLTPCVGPYRLGNVASSPPDAIGIDAVMMVPPMVGQPGAENTFLVGPTYAYR